jgi:hypothetical protein
MKAIDWRNGVDFPVSQRRDTASELITWSPVPRACMFPAVPPQGGTSADRPGDPSRVSFVGD